MQSAEALHPESRVRGDRTAARVTNSRLASGRVLVMGYRKAQAQATQAAQTAVMALDWWGTQVKHKFERTREQKPLHIIAATAGAALLIGALLRIWRSKAS